MSESPATGLSASAPYTSAVAPSDASVAAFDAGIDAAAVAAWADEVTQAYRRRGRLQGGIGHKLVHFPRWAALIFVRKAREIGWKAALQLVLTMVLARLRRRR